MVPEQIQINSILTDLNSRNKELDALYKIDEALNNYEISMRRLLHEIISLIIPVFRYNDICVARIVLDDTEAETEGYSNKELKLVEDIISEKTKVGQITIVYTKTIREEKGVFLMNERNFLKTVANKIGAYYYYKNLRETIASLQNKETPVTEVNTTEEKVRLWLRNQKLNEDDITKMLKVKIDFKKGETIIKQGAIASYIILLTEGLSKNYLEGFQERGFIFKIVKPINFIGNSALFGDNTYSFSGSALTNCSAYLIDSQIIKNLLTSNEGFAKKMLNWYCNVTQGHLARMSSLANKQSLGRFAEILLYLSNEIFNGPIITTNVSRKDIAELAAISTESGVRFLSDLKRDKIINIHPNRIEILKPEVLKLIAG
ncbi:MAG: Crp/Fnr family transcriptional regulator [Bacteroidales bacterium]|nr:Crp/Fnr family transcriptional regulator [Bacteroidales bacterium]